jgi:hypothetical protein
MLTFSRWSGALLLTIGIALPALSQQKEAPKAGGEEVTIKWEFQKDKPFYQEMTTSTKQTMKLMGQDLSQTQKQTFTFSWTPKEQTKEKNWVIVQKIEAIQMEVEIAGNKVNFDSVHDASNTGNALADFFKALVGSELKITLSPDLKIVSIEGREEFIKKLVAANPQMEPLLKQILGDEGLRQMAEPTFAAIPATPVKPGSTWEKKLALNLGPIGTFDTTYKFTYEGKEGKLEKIKIDAGLTYNPPGANVSGALPFKIKSAQLASKGGIGKFLFDSEKKRMDSSELKLTLDGNLQIDIGGMVTDVNLNQEQTTTVKTTDTNPTKPAETPKTPEAAPKK